MSRAATPNDDPAWGQIDCGEKLRALAAARGDKGVAKVVEDADSFDPRRAGKAGGDPGGAAALLGRWSEPGRTSHRSSTDRRSLLQLAARVLRLRFHRWAA